METKEQLVKRVEGELKQAGVEFWFLPLLQNEMGYESFASYFNFSLLDVEKKKKEGYFLHLAGLCHTTMSLISYSSKPGEEATTAGLIQSFHRLAMSYNKHLQDSDPNFKGEYDDKGFPIY